MTAGSKEQQESALAMGLSATEWIRQSYDADPVMSVCCCVCLRYLHLNSNIYGPVNRWAATSDLLASALGRTFCTKGCLLDESAIPLAEELAATFSAEKLFCHQS